MANSLEKSSKPLSDQPCEFTLGSQDMPPARGRSKSEEKRAQILEAASELFLSHGFDQVTMILVAEKAQVSKQTVYSHFGSKDELFCAAIESRCESFQLIDLLEDFERPIKETLMQLAHQFHQLINSFEGLRIYCICAANNMNADTDNHISELFWQAGPEKVKSALIHYFETQQQAGKIHLDNAHFAGQQFLYMLKAEDNMRKVLGLDDLGSEQEQHAYLHSSVELFCRGYGIQ